MIIRKMIMETDVFKELDGMVQTMMLKKGNVEQIRHGVAVCKNIGFDQWERQTNATPRIKLIVKEIFIKQS